MKKTYINPNIEVVKIASQMQMLAGSNRSLNITNGKVEENTPGEARAFDFFDED